MTDSPNQPGIDPMTGQGDGQPYNLENFQQIGVTQAWKKYGDRLTFGRGQTLAILDDGCDLTDPTWQAQLPWGPKVIATYNSIDDNDDPTPVPPGYHGTTVGHPSSLNHNGVRGLAYNNHVAQVRCASIVHLPELEDDTIARAMDWVIQNHQRYHITAVNLSVLDDQPHTLPLASAIDAPLKTLRELGIWVSAPCGNHNYTNGISWPACAENCFAIGGVKFDSHEVYLDRYTNTDLLVCAAATSSSNAYAAASSMVMREALDVTGYPWREHADNLAEAIMAIFHLTGGKLFDPGTRHQFVELNLLAALDHVFARVGA